MKTIGITANLSKNIAAPTLRRLAGCAKSLGLKLATCDGTKRLLPEAKVLSQSAFCRTIDALMALGGDGTMLYAVRMIGDADVPVIGVNLGSLGFLTSVPVERMEDALCALATGETVETCRARLDCRLYREKRIRARYTALNDVVLGWGINSRVVTLTLGIDGEPVDTTVCDGLIVCTPTGSTGHSLSAGGPVLHPETPAFVINPICPHTLSNRPIVVPDRSRIELLVGSSDKGLLLVVDGQDHLALKRDDRIVVSRAAHNARTLHLPDSTYFQVLRQKLHWRGSSVGGAKA